MTGFSLLLTGPGHSLSKATELSEISIPPALSLSLLALAEAEPDKPTNTDSAHETEGSRPGRSPRVVSCGQPAVPEDDYTSICAVFVRGKPCATPLVPPPPRNETRVRPDPYRAKRFG